MPWPAAQHGICPAPDMPADALDLMPKTPSRRSASLPGELPFTVLQATLGMADANNVPESHDERRARISELMAREATAAKEGKTMAWLQSGYLKVFKGLWFDGAAANGARALCSLSKSPECGGAARCDRLRGSWSQAGPEVPA